VHRSKTETEPIHRPRSEVLHQHVGHVDQPPEHLLARLALHVEGDAFLVAIDGQEIGRLVALIGRGEGARIITLAGLLDLNHLGAEIAELHGAIGSRQDAREIDDTKPF
jgi:hypothetical protein